MPGLANHNWKPRFSSTTTSLLDGFYRPALMDAVRYWRLTGYFTSRTLLQVLNGVEQLVAAAADGRGHGQIRLIAGVLLSRQDITALATGAPLEQVLTEHLVQSFPFRDVQPGAEDNAALGAELLAWLVLRGHMEIRVALPLHNGKVARDGAIFHAKEGVIEDCYGQRLVFTGSVNETPNGWTSNYESLTTHCSWQPGGAPYLDDFETTFQRLWQNQDPAARTFTLPEAVRQQLAIFQPVEGEGLPRRLQLHLEQSGKKTDTKTSDNSAHKVSTKHQPPRSHGATSDMEQRRRTVWRYVLNAAASDLPGRERVGEATSAVQPWPHQQRAFQRLWQTWPPRLLIADEVGLGKTVQAGLLLRQAWLSGRAQRILVMAPASVLKQWQRELREKFALDWPIYTGKSLDWQPTCLRPDGTSRPVERSRWVEEPCLLVSSHLMRRQDRQPELLNAPPWDLVVLDEAHHARTSRPTGGSGADRRRPNALMKLMQQLQAKDRTKGLLLLTATPMQVSALELRDLLSLLGLPPQWTEEAFTWFFAAVDKQNPDEDTLHRLARLWQAHTARCGEPPSTLLDRLCPSLIKRRRVERALQDRDPLSRNGLSKELRHTVLALAKAWTPVQGLVSRHSRNLLRTYRKQGAVDIVIGDRHVDDRFLIPSAAERELYEAVERFISTRYARASAQKKSAVGFVMTIYRRRLASSVAALVATLEKRLAGPQLHPLDEEDAAASEDDDLPTELEGDKALQAWATLEDAQHERNAIHALLQQARPLLGQDSKTAELRNALEQLRKQGYEQVIVFSQYTATVDALKQQLTADGYTSLMTFTGEGGAHLDRRVQWQTLSRDEVKKRFRQGAAPVLLCTDAAAEGLNLQFCGALINYDMPWNPMRVEQRIGRIDRIDQQHPTMQIINFHLDGTVEADVYRALKGRIRMFEQVVGKLQPILAKAESSIKAILVGPKERAAAVAELQQTQAIPGLHLDDDLQDLDAIRDAMENTQPSPLRLQDLEAILRQPELLPPGCAARPIGHDDFAWSQPGLEKEHRITCDPHYYGDNSESCELWAPGSPLFPLQRAKDLTGGDTTPCSRQTFQQALQGQVRHPSCLNLPSAAVAIDADPHHP